MISEVRQIRIPQPTVSSGLGDFASLQSINPSERLNSLYISSRLKKEFYVSQQATSSILTNLPATNCMMILWSVVP